VILWNVLLTYFGSEVELQCSMEVHMVSIILRILVCSGVGCASKDTHVLFPLHGVQTFCFEYIHEANVSNLICRSRLMHKSQEYLTNLVVGMVKKTNVFGYLIISLKNYSCLLLLKKCMVLLYFRLQFTGYRT
jgi:hypothetical protein